MYDNRNVLKIVASALLLISLPAGAQALGGNLGGAANGTFGGTFGPTDIHGAARAVAGAGIDASGPAGTMRERADNIGARSREMGAGAAGTARSRVDSTHRGADAATHTAAAVGADASRRTVNSAAQTRNSATQNAAAQSNVEPGVQPNGGLLMTGSGAAAGEQDALGRRVSAESAAEWQASADRSHLAGSAASGTAVSVEKDQPAR